MLLSSFPSALRSPISDLRSGIYWAFRRFGAQRKAFLSWPKTRDQTDVSAGATMSNHLIEQGETTFPGDYRTPSAGMSTRARILLGLFVLLIVCVAYLWFFGFQTLILLEARYLTRKAPVVRMAPAQLTDSSISRSAGRKLSYFGYEFEVPWNDVDEAKSGLIPDSNKAMIVFQSGNSLSVWHGSPRAFLNTVLSNDKIDQNTLRRIVGDEALQSDYALYRTILQMTPEKMTPFQSQSDAANHALLLLVKGICMPAGSDSGVFSMSAGEFFGFQFGRPANPSGEVSVRLFSSTSSLNFIFLHPAGGPVVISQPDINRILQTLHKTTSPHVAAANSSN